MEYTVYGIERWFYVPYIITKKVKFLLFFYIKKVIIRGRMNFMFYGDPTEDDIKNSLMDKYSEIPYNRNDIIVKMEEKKEYASYKDYSLDCDVQCAKFIKN